MKIYFSGSPSHRGTPGFIRYLESTRRNAGVRRRMLAYTPDTKVMKKVTKAFTDVYKGKRAN
jgi:hypothetical protein